MTASAELQAATDESALRTLPPLPPAAVRFRRRRGGRTYRTRWSSVRGGGGGGRRRPGGGLASAPCLKGAMKRRREGGGEGGTSCEMDCRMPSVKDEARERLAGNMAATADTLPNGSASRPDRGVLPHCEGRVSHDWGWPGAVWRVPVRTPRPKDCPAPLTRSISSASASGERVASRNIWLARKRRRASVAAS